MTLNPSGTMRMGGDAPGESIAQELGRNLYATISLNDGDVRALLGRPSGSISISDAWGKSNKKEISFTFTTSVPDCTLDVHDIGGYVAGVSDVVITVNPGVYLYATSTDIYGLRIQGAIPGDNVTLVNKGVIIGRGGKGGNGCNHFGLSGGHALSLGQSLVIDNTFSGAYIAGGGGGGTTNTFGGGGGGAGGGDGNFTIFSTAINGGYGGSIGNKGGNGCCIPCGCPLGYPPGYGGGAGGGGSGMIVDCETTTNGGGGGGGRIVPGNGGLGGGSDYLGCVGGNGGSSNSPGGQGGNVYGSGGGGGWGAPGGAGGPYSGSEPGGSGGPSIATYGNAVSFVNGDTSRVWGSIV